MKILILGAGAVGGYFGARLVESGADVTFLVRDARAAQIASDGLVIKAATGESRVAAKTTSAASLTPQYDVVLLTAKAYDLQSSIDAIRPAMSDATFVVPLLNGMRHLDELDRAFGGDRVLGGTAHVSATLDETRVIRLFTPFAIITQGPRVDAQRAFSKDLNDVLERAAFEARHSDDIIGVMWEKWTFLATLAGATTLMRGTIADIVKAGGGDFCGTLYDECCAVAVAGGHTVAPDIVAATRATLTSADFAISASMLRDMERRSPTEAAHVVGDMVRRGIEAGVPTPALSLAWSNLQVYTSRLDAPAPSV